MKKIECFPLGAPGKIKALSELLHVCAESLSSGQGDSHAVMRRRSVQQANLAIKIEEQKKKANGDVQQPVYPLDKEQRLLEALGKGDIQSSGEILTELLATLIYAHPDHFQYIQYRAMELAILLSRVDTGPGLSSEILLEICNRNFITIQEARNIEELCDILHGIVNDIASLISDFQGIRHIMALKKAEYYILENYTRKISLSEIADVSGFSSPYFSTIFKEEMGENLSAYINRLRVERACFLLLNTKYSLGKITRACGYEDQSWFSKMFKAYTGVTPGIFRTQGENYTQKKIGTFISDNYRRTQTNEAPE